MDKHQAIAEGLMEAEVTEEELLEEEYNNQPDYYDQEEDDFEYEQYQQEKAQAEYDLQHDGPLYSVVLRNCHMFPQTHIYRQGPHKSSGMRGDITIHKNVTSELRAKQLAKKELQTAFNRLGVEIHHPKDSSCPPGVPDGLYACTIGGKIIATCWDVCLICKEYRGCDFDGERCGILS